jgi:YD repeat-containing protein
VQGYDYQTHAAGTGSDSFTWNLDIPQDGTYRVYVQYPAVAGAATTAHNTVNYNGGFATATVDQSKNSSSWVLLGSYAFSQANTGQKISLAQNATGAVAADAVKVVRDNSADTQPNPVSFTYTYDPDGNPTDLADASPNARYDDYALSYDGLNQLTQTQEKTSGTVKHTTTFGYDAAGNAVSEGHDGATASYSFNVLNALTQVVNKESSSDPNPKTTSYTYNADGRIATETKANGNVVTSSYNLDNSVASTVEKTSGGTLVTQHTYTFDPDGNQTQDVSAVQSADNNATTLNRTATHTFTPRDQVGTVTHSDGNNNQSYTYDLAGNITAQTVGGTTTTNVYDRNRLLTATTGGVTVAEPHVVVAGGGVDAVGVEAVDVVRVRAGVAGGAVAGALVHPAVLAVVVLAVGGVAVGGLGVAVDVGDGLHAFADTAMCTDPYTGNRYAFGGGKSGVLRRPEGNEYELGRSGR